jgi:hypothetical protein
VKEMPNLPEVPCRCWSTEVLEENGCICGPSERVLRGVKNGDARLTDEQREWCLGEIDKVEGYSRDEYDIADDFTLANGVLCAWTDYCRDKGLL